MKKGSSFWRRLKKCFAFVALAAAFLGLFAWYKFFREVPQPAFASPEMQFKYGSLGAEGDRGIPYLIWLVLPRIFADKLPGPGGYASFGLPWEPGEELPIGFAKKTVGFPRITNNCALCHTASYRTSPGEVPRFVVAGPSHTSNVQRLIRFLSDAAEDPRFTPDVILREIEYTYELSWLDKQLYRYLIIPFTKKALRQQKDQFAWMNRHGWPEWGAGRDDPMNLTKYFMTQMPVDDTVGSADFPSIWKLSAKEGQYLNWSGDTPAPLSVLIDSALGLGAPPDPPFESRMRELEAWLKAMPAPTNPFAAKVDDKLKQKGVELYKAHCASCHAPDGPETRKVVDIGTIGTDRERLDTWSQAAADEANRRVKAMGIDRPNMVKQNGYISPPLDGLWLRGPYLHNGSVPNLRQLLEPEEKRTPVFHRGYDVLDSDNVGFVTAGPDAERLGFRYDTTERGNGNKGHNYGTGLSPDEKGALLEYLKTL
jgi:mono/diheme cytochrome c family protein